MNIIHGIIALGLVALGIYSLVARVQGSTASGQCGSGGCEGSTGCGSSCATSGSRLISISSAGDTRRGSVGADMGRVKGR